ncbi:MAG TPA: helix-turn-helix domain-containing protein [Schlesneria sp.]|jgi:methanogenic corrinoid protein MtbC1
MENLSDLVSPKQVARAIGVSESSLKRWCDQGLIKTVKTVGGHRKMQVSDVLRFIRDRDQELVSPEILELPPTTERAELGLSRGRPLLVEALLNGNEEVARQVVFDLYLAKHSLCVICDEVIAGAFRDIGHRWACNEADMYQERRGCEIALRILFDLRRRQKLPSKSKLAIGGTIEGDVYALPSTMAELVLREAGWNATSLGTSLPFRSLIRAIRETQPKLFWLSVSHIQPSIDFIKEFNKFSRACRDTETELVVGGRVIAESLRRQMKNAEFCESMQQLDLFARALGRKRPKPKRVTSENL